MKTFFLFLSFLLLFLNACKNGDSDDDDMVNSSPDDDNDDDSPTADDDTEIPKADLSQLNLALFAEYSGSDDDSVMNEKNDNDHELSILHYNGISWSSIISADRIQISGFWGLSPDSIWAGGFSWGGENNEPLVIHNDHGNWEMEKISGYPDCEIRGIGGSGDDNIYLVGLNDNITYLILHYDGIEWSLERTGTFGSSFDAVWVSEAGEVFAVGTAGSYNDMNYQPLITHYDGRQWADTILPVPDMDCWLTDVWGTSADSVFAVGECYFGEFIHRMPLFIHYDGSTWTNIPTGIDPFAQMTFEQMDGYSDKEIYISGKTWNYTSRDKGILYLYDGNSLTDLKMPIYNNGGYPYIVGIWVADSGMVFVSGPTPYPGGHLRPRILLYENQQWSAISAFYNIYTIYGFLK